MPVRIAELLHERDANPGERAFDVRIGRIEFEDGFGLGETLSISTIALKSLSLSLK
jgi:hypothetical protein